MPGQNTIIIKKITGEVIQTIHDSGISIIPRVSDTLRITMGTSSILFKVIGVIIGVPNKGIIEILVVDLVK